MNNKILHVVDDILPKIVDERLIVSISSDLEGYKNSVNLLSLFKEQQFSLKDKLLSFNAEVAMRLQNQVRDKEAYQYILSNLFFEKSAYKTDYIYLFYKLNIIIDFIQENNIEEIKVYSSRSNIINFFKKLSASKGFKFECKKVRREVKLKNFIIQSKPLSFLYKIRQNHQKIKQRITKNRLQNKKVVVSYYPNFYFNDSGEFISKYYAEMSQELNKNFDWLFIYAGDVNKLNAEHSMLKSKNFVNYNFLDVYITYSDFYIIWKKFIKLNAIYKKICLNTLFICSDVNYFDILIDDWNASLSVVLLDTLIFEKKFQNYFDENKCQEVVYLVEEQPWEQMLNKTLQKKGIISKGAIHATVRPNSLTHFHHPDVKKNIFHPNYMGVNSPFAKEVYLRNGFLKSSIIDIEAQRFMYLLEKKSIKNVTSNNLLITTSIDHKETKELLEVFSKSYVEGLFVNIYIKSHPDLPVLSITSNIKGFPSFTPLQGNMKDAFNLVGTVFVANGSSVLLESLLNLKKTITLFSLNSLPMPALNQHPLLEVITTSKELQNAFLNKDKKFTLDSIEAVEILHLDSEFRGWRELLNA